MTADKLYLSLAANATMAKLVQLLSVEQTEKHCSLDSEDDFCLGC